MVDGVDRVFSDEKRGAVETARELKKRNRGSKIQIKDRSNGNLNEMLEDGRIRVKRHPGHFAMPRNCGASCQLGRTLMRRLPHFVQ
jgi:hypothetical protein